MNTSEGFQKALEFEPSVRLLIQSLEMINIVSQAQVLYLLAAVCVVSPEAHKYESQPSPTFVETWVSPIIFPRVLTNKFRLFSTITVVF